MRLAKDEFLPCPFCGAIPETYRWDKEITDLKYVVVCNNDGGLAAPCLIGDTREQALDAWNKRAK